MKRTAVLSATCVVALLSLAWLMGPATQQMPTILVLPYLQPGDGRALTGTDVKAVVWLTDQTPADFAVEISGPSIPTRTVYPTRTALDFAVAKAPKKEKADPAASKNKDDKKAPDEDKKTAKKAPDEDKKTAKKAPPEEKEQHFFRYTAYLDQLPFNASIKYRVKVAGQVIREATFRTRPTADKSVRCVLMGDMAQGRPAQKAVAYQISLRKPQFLIALGDIVYPTGRVSQYMSHFWTTYNDVPVAGPKEGAPLMSTVTFYPVVGNHDVSAKYPSVPDGLAVYYFFLPPKGGPGLGPWITPLGKDKSAVAKIRKAAADSYPNLDVYSFDYGPAHFVALNSNSGIDINAAAFRQWLLDDLKASKAAWKIVCYHAPGFQSAITHYTEQQCRLLQPIFEEGGVDLAIAGHVHNYQRSVPIRFTPDGGRDKKGKVNGTFKLDTTFDGAENTRPNGVIHIVAGGGGASLNGPGLEKTSAQLHKNYDADNYVDYTAKMVVDRHTFVTLDLAPDHLQLQTFAGDGEIVDHITVTKK